MIVQLMGAEIRALEDAADQVGIKILGAEKYRFARQYIMILTWIFMLIR